MHHQPLATRTNRPARRYTLADCRPELIVQAYDSSRPAGAPAWHELPSTEQRRLTAMAVRSVTRG
jgi:hypothetical protein